MILNIGQLKGTEKIPMTTSYIGISILEILGTIS